MLGSIEVVFIIMMVPCGGLLAEDVDFWQTIFRASKILPEDGDSKSLFAGPDYRDAMNAMVHSGLMPGFAEFSKKMVLPS